MKLIASCMDCGKSDGFTSVEYGDGDVDYVYCQCGMRSKLQLELVHLVEDDAS
jgi:hypothetical protein